MISSSRLKHLLNDDVKGFLEFSYNRGNATPAMVLGSLIHQLILEPEKHIIEEMLKTNIKVTLDNGDSTSLKPDFINYIKNKCKSLRENELSEYLGGTILKEHFISKGDLSGTLDIYDISNKQIYDVKVCNNTNFTCPDKQITSNHGVFQALMYKKLTDTYDEPGLDNFTWILIHNETLDIRFIKTDLDIFKPMFDKYLNLARNILEKKPSLDKYTSLYNYFTSNDVEIIPIKPYYITKLEEQLNENK